MRAAVAAIAVSLLAVIAIAQDDAPAPTFELQQRWVKGFTYTTEEAETVSSATVFFLQLNDGSELRQAGGITDKHTRTLEVEPTAFDEQGATQLKCSVPSHTLVRTELPPGESASRITHNGKGPLHEAAWTEDWRDDYWKRTPTGAARGPGGQFPEEFDQAMQVRRGTRHHWLLPDQPVAVGDTWKPATKELLAGLKQFSRGKDEPKVTAECKLESVDGGKSVIQFTWKVEGLKPVKSDTASSWKDDTTVKVEGKVTLTLHLEDKYVVSEVAETTAKLEGSLWNSTGWLRAEATLTFTRSSTTTRAAKAD